MSFSIHPLRFRPTGGRLRHFSIISFVTVTYLFVLYTPSYAGLCGPLAVEKESPYQYMLALIESMGYAKEATQRHDQERSTDTDDNLFKVFYGLKLAKADFECAELQVSPYISSTNETIKASAESAALSFSMLAALQEEAAQDMKSTLDAGSKEFKRGTVLERRVEWAASLDNAWKLLPQAAILATYTAVEEDAETKLMSRLALTTNQRKEILHKLHSMLGEEITKGIKTGQSSLTAAGAVLYQVIGTQTRKTRDNK